MPAPLNPVTYGPYSPFREAAGLIFTAGQTGVDPATKTASPELAGQVEQALQNLAGVLATAGLKLSDVVKTTIFLTDMNDFQAVNEIYVKHFPEPRPARSCVAVRELPRVAPGIDLKVEIEAVAVRPST
jgi:2-iminobutanoate/2-iminopropanoate deaminase